MEIYCLLTTWYALSLSLFNTFSVLTLIAVSSSACFELLLFCSPNLGTISFVDDYVVHAMTKWIIERNQGRSRSRCRERGWYKTQSTTSYTEY